MFSGTPLLPCSTCSLTELTVSAPTTPYQERKQYTDQMKSLHDLLGREMPYLKTLKLIDIHLVDSLCQLINERHPTILNLEDCVYYQSLQKIDGLKTLDIIIKKEIKTKIHLNQNLQRVRVVFAPKSKKTRPNVYLMLLNASDFIQCKYLKNHSIYRVHLLIRHCFPSDILSSTNRCTR